jgi:hypothetical protein
MTSEDVAKAFREAGREFLGLPEFRLRDLLIRVSDLGATQKDIGQAIDISEGHVGRLIRGQPISIRDQSLKRLYDLSGLNFKSLIYANALNAVDEDERPLLDEADERGDGPFIPTTAVQIEATPALAPDLPLPAPAEIELTAWQRRGVIGYCRLPVSEFESIYMTSIRDALLRTCTWESERDHGPLPPLTQRDNIVYVRASSPLMEPTKGEEWAGECSIPRGSIIEVDMNGQRNLRDGSVVYVQFDSEPADFYEYSHYLEGAHEAEIYTPRNGKYPTRVIRLPYTPDTMSIKRWIIGVAKRIVEKSL